MKRRLLNKLNRAKSGFTLVELIVAMTVAAILIGVGAFSLVGWRNHAEYLKNEQTARTVYLAAQSALSEEKSKGLLSKTLSDIRTAAGSSQIRSASGDKGLVGLPTIKDDNGIQHEYASLTVSSDTATTDKENQEYYKLISPYIYDSGVLLKGSIVIEFDLTAGNVYSVFYSEWTGSFEYGVGKNTSARGTYYIYNNDGINTRAVNQRQSNLVGYYSSDQTNVAVLSAVRLSLADVHLNNTETLDLTFGNTSPSLVNYSSYTINFYNTADTSADAMAIQTLTFSGTDLLAAANSADGMIDVTINMKNYQIPVTWDGKKFDLIFDAMMTSQMQALISTDTAANMSAVRFFGNDPINIKAVVSIGASQDVTGGSSSGYITGNPKTSETQNDLFATTSSDNTYYGISTNRHLYNIRYSSGFSGTGSSTVKEVRIIENLDWTKNYVLSFKASGSTVDSSIVRLDPKTDEFPTIPTLASGYTLNGNGKSYSNLKLGSSSYVTYTKTGDTAKYTNTADSVALIAKSAGTLTGINFVKTALNTASDSEMNIYNDSETKAQLPASYKSSSILTCAILCGTDEGGISSVSFDKDCEVSAETLKTSKEAAAGSGIGMLCGVVHMTDNKIGNEITKITVDGTLSGTLASSDDTAVTGNSGKYAGIGSVCGYMYTSKTSSDNHINESASKAVVSGNKLTGGIVGSVVTSNNSSSIKKTQVLNCKFTGKILAPADGADTNTNAYYFGGIAGYAVKSFISGCSAAVNCVDSLKIKLANADNIKAACLGNYVGGITGYASGGSIYNCTTPKDKYVIGYDNVGGITGGADDCTIVSKTADGKTETGTSNNSMVIGHSFVGGIIGVNKAGSTIKNCINKALTCGYGIDVGGIAGKNEGTSENNKAVITNCSNYVLDFNRALHTLAVTTWKMTASNVGGIAGYNHFGTISYKTEDSLFKSNTAVSAVLSGQNNVGGVVGYNDVGTDITLALGTNDYIGGDIEGSGDCVGGYIGLNLSSGAFSNKDVTNAMKIKAGYIKGRYCVGGIVGANLIKSDNDVYMNMIYENGNGTVQGTSLVGGLLGYQEMISTISGTAMTDTAASSDGWYSAFLNRDTTSHLFTPNSSISPDTNHVLYIGTQAGNNTTISNTATVKAVTLGGGLIGLNCADSKMVIKNCINKGSVTELPDTGDNKIPVNSLVKESGITDVTALIGGIVSYNTKNSVIDNCENQGDLNSTGGGFGGVVGLNEGYVVNCTNSKSINKNGLNYIGGIAAINYRNKTSDASISVGNNYKYDPGTIYNCSLGSSNASVIINGGNYTGGIAGINYAEDSGYLPVIKNCSLYANLSAGVNVGGVTGYNVGKIDLSSSIGGSSSVRGSSNVGGIAGLNGNQADKKTGIINCTAKAGTSSGLTVNATANYAGGIVGNLAYGDLGGSEKQYLINQAKVSAAGNYAGGIAGIADIGSTISYAENDGQVQASAGYAGGITAKNSGDGTTSSTIRNSVNCGNVTSSLGYAAGIAAQNNGLIDNCSVDSKNGSITLLSGQSEAGIITCLNKSTGTITGCGTSALNNSITLQASSASVIGYIAGRNQGVIYGGTVSGTLNYQTNKTAISLGGISGINESGAVIGNADTTTTVSCSFNDFSGVKYLGGLAGDNIGTIRNSSFTGEMSEMNSSSNGNAYGGISGINEGESLITDCYLDGAKLTIVGSCTIDTAQSASDKLNNTSFTGGICGYNQAGAVIRCSYLSGDGNSISASYGMEGGITGANNGSLNYCGYDSTTYSSGENSETYTTNMKIVSEVVTALGATENTADKKDTLNNALSSKSDHYERLPKGSNSGTTIQMNNKGYGYLGGVTGFNSTSGSVVGCASGAWYVYGNNLTQNAVIGGVIGQNESEADVMYDVNCAYVHRYLDVSQFGDNEYNANDTEFKQSYTVKEDGKNVTKYHPSLSFYYVGGVIGEQQNRTSSNWKIVGCVNYGDVEDQNSHNVGGVIARWRNNGGTVYNCLNYGTLKTNYEEGKCGTVAGIVGFINQTTIGQDLNIISSDNHGIVNQYNKYGANDCAGIVAEINTGSDEDTVNVNISDCVNGSDAEVYGWSMADGILSYVGGTGGATKNVQVNIDRCRNYSNEIKGSGNSDRVADRRYRCAGIFGTRSDYGPGYTTITNCFSVFGDATETSSYTNGNGYPIAFAQEGAGEKGFKNCKNNYYMDDVSFSNKTGELNENEGASDTSKNYIKDCYVFYNNEEYRRSSDNKNNVAAFTQLNVSAMLDGNNNNYCGFNWYEDAKPQIVLKLAKTIKSGSKIMIKAWGYGNDSLTLNVDNTPKKGKTHTYSSESENTWMLNSDTDSININITKGTKINDKFTDNRFTIYEISVYDIDGTLLYTGNPLEQYAATQIGAKRLYAGTDKTARDSSNKNCYFGALPVNSSAVMKNMTSSNSYIDTTSDPYIIKDSEKNIRAGILIKYGETEEYSGLDYTDVTDEAILDYYNNYLEDSEKGYGAPRVTVTPADGEYEATWTDDTSTETKYNPLYYLMEVLVYKVDKGVNVTLDTTDNSNPVLRANDGSEVTKVGTLSYKEYKQKGTFRQDSSWSNADSDYYFVVRVKAQGYDETGNDKSKWGYAAPLKGKTAMPTPDLEIVREDGVWMLRLKNSDAYSNINGWQVIAYVVGNEGKKYTFNSNIKEIKYTNGLTDNKPLRATASTTDEDSQYMNSLLYTANVYVPTGNYPNNGKLNVTDNKFIGTTDQDLAYQATLTYTSDVTYPQGFRMEIVGKDNTAGSEWYGQYVTVASKDVSLAKDSATTVTIDNLPVDILKNYSDFNVNVWYATSGVGPVYTYYSTTEATVTALAVNGDVRSKGYDIVYQSDGSYAYYMCDPLKNNNLYTNNHYKKLTDSFTFLSAPVLNEPELTVDNNNMTYTFSWDNEAASSNLYSVSLNGLTLSQSGVVTSSTVISIDYSSGTSFTVNADDWAYDAVSISVTRKGTGTASEGKLEIGQTTTEQYTVKEHLPKMTAPSAELLSTDGLNYKISWTPYADSAASKTHTKSYSLYLIDAAKAVHLLTTTNDNSGSVLDAVDLDDYAGQTVQIYLVANAIENDGKYITSLTGDILDLEVKSRLDQPTVDSFELKYDKYTDNANEVVSEDSFVSSGSYLISNIVEDTQLDGNYLTGGLLYSTITAAQDALNSLPADTGSASYASSVMTAVNELAGADLYNTFGLKDTVFKSSFDSQSGDVSKYTLPISSLEQISNLEEGEKPWNISFAGDYLIPFVRSSGNALDKSDSIWSWNDILELPKVQFDTPAVTSAKTEKALTGSFYQTATDTTASGTLTTSKMALDTYTFGRNDSYASYYDIDMSAVQHERQTDNTEDKKTNINWKLRLFKQSGMLCVNIYKNPTENETYSDPQNVLSAWHAKENKTHTETEVTKGNIKTVYDVYGTGTADAYTIVKTYSVTPASENTEETDTLITTAYYYGEDKSDPADPTDLSDCTLSLITAPLNTLASGTGQSASLIIPGTENQINGSYEYTNSASQKVTGYYSFVRGIEIDLATDANGYDTYSVITPSTGDGFEFAGTNTSGVSVSGSGTKSDAYTASSDYYTCTNSDSTKYVNSDAENVKTNH